MESTPPNSAPESSCSPELVQLGGTTPEAAVDSDSPSSWRDFLGITASIACAIHCAAMPFVIGFLPALGLSFLADESFHKWMAGGCFLIALMAFVPGWKRHRRCLPATVAATGLLIVTATAFGLSDECCAACEANAVAATSGDSLNTEVVADCCAECESTSTESTVALTSQTDVPDCCAECEKEATTESTTTALVTQSDVPDCCAECESSAETQATAVALAAKTEVADCCEHCAENEAAGTADKSTTTESDREIVAAGFMGFLTNYAAWWTPLGGLMMVYAHLLNRCFVSRCVCCESGS